MINLFFSPSNSSLVARPKSPTLKFLKKILTYKFFDYFKFFNLYEKYLTLSSIFSLKNKFPNFLF